MFIAEVNILQTKNFILYVSMLFELLIISFGKQTEDQANTTTSDFYGDNLNNAVRYVELGSEFYELALQTLNEKRTALLGEI